MAYATNRVHGLGLEPSAFWAMTPRELAAHSKLMDRAREVDQHLYAGLQATLHNAHFDHPKRKPFTAEMFLPDYREKQRQNVPEWKRDLEQARAAVATLRRTDPRATEQGKSALLQFSDRTRRAAEARQRGESREVIERIMTGVA